MRRIHSPTLAPWLGSVLAILVGTAACTTRSPLPDDDAGDGSPSSDDDASPDDPGDQPTEAGVMFSPCEESSQCAPQEFCVFPQDESGYCTSACNAPTDPSNCEAAPGGQPLTCFDIGLVDGRQVCALDCVSATCPRGMRCEAVATAAGERSICF